MRQSKFYHFSITINKVVFCWLCCSFYSWCTVLSLCMSWKIKNKSTWANSAKVGARRINLSHLMMERMINKRVVLIVHRYLKYILWGDTFLWREIICNHIALTCMFWTYRSDGTTQVVNAIWGLNLQTTNFNKKINTRLDTENHIVKILDFRNNANFEWKCWLYIHCHSNQIRKYIHFQCLGLAKAITTSTNLQCIWCCETRSVASTTRLWWYNFQLGHYFVQYIHFVAHYRGSQPRRAHRGPQSCKQCKLVDTVLTLCQTQKCLVMGAFSDLDAMTTGVEFITSTKIWLLKAQDFG